MLLYCIRQILTQANKALSIRTLPCILALSVLLFACRDKDEAPPTAPQEITFRIIDSIKVSPFFADTYPELYTTLNGKTYQTLLTSKVEGYFEEVNNTVVLYFRDTTDIRTASWVRITIKGRLATSLEASFSATNTS